MTKLPQFSEIIFRGHAVQRMFERRISEDDVRSVLTSGEIIETYPDDQPYPSSLILGWSEGRPLHIVAATNEKDRETVIITVYEPDQNLWDRKMKARRKQ